MGVMEHLPIEAVLPRLIEQLRERRAAVLTAPAGAGKSTRVPPALLSAGIPAVGQIVMLQPRRLAARAVARMMARAFDEPVGRTVGYRVRFEDKSCAQTRVLVVTEGILTRRFLADPFLEGVGCVILDEFHERTVHVDLALAFVRELMQVREELRLVVMSATLSRVEPLLRFLGPGCDQIACETAVHPLQIDYLRRPELGRRPLPDQVAAGLRRMLGRDDDDGGDLLVFLPGAAEIRGAKTRLEEESLPGQPELVPLYGALSAPEQDRVLQPGARRRVILSTNIAETSLTVPGVTAVVDSGLVKRLSYDPRTGMDRLELGQVSAASATQRAGRAGRTAPGRVLRLWTEEEQRTLPKADPPEILRVDLSSALLSILAFHPSDPHDLPLFEPPSRASVDAALSLLLLLGAVERAGEEGRMRLTALGQRLAAFPLHPRVGAMLEASRSLGLEGEAALLAALLGERDLLRHDAGPPPTTSSDLLLRRYLYLDLERRHFSERAARELGVDLRAAHQVRQAEGQLLRLIRTTPAPNRESPERSLLQLVLAGFPDRVCRRRRPGKPEAKMVGGRGVRLSEASGVRDAELFVALEADAGKRGLHAVSVVRVASAVDEQQLGELFPEQLRSSIATVFDEQSQAIKGVRRRCYADLLLAEEEGVDVEPLEAARLLAAEAAQRFEQVFRPDREARQLIARLRFAAAHLPLPWLDVSEQGLKALLPELCQAGHRSLDELRRLDWAKELQSRLTHRQHQLLEREVPARLQVPSGRWVVIDYAEALGPGGAPVLAVKLQEVFGLAETPRVCGGRVPLRLHLLAPNGRPVQVTQDLRSFWSETYAEVRKDLRGRYPKHPWPADPWSARPTSRTKPRGS